jgi:hypothetical protein
MRVSILLMIAGVAWSADVMSDALSRGETNVGLVRHPTRLRLSGEVIQLANGEDMALAGLGYDALAPIPWLPGLWTGISGYGAVAGDRGGLFVLGVSGGWREPLGEHLVAEVGVFAGGGGGASAGQGDGLLLRGHAQLGWRFVGNELALGIARDDFVGGSIEGTSLTVGWQVDDVVTLLGEAVAFPAMVDRRTWTMAPIAATFVSADERGRSGALLADHIELVGFAIERYLTPNWSVPLRMAAAVTGDAAGYMEVMSGVAWQGSTRYAGIAPIADLLVGAGGGGDIDTGGGILVRPELGIAVGCGRSFDLRIRSGWTEAPDGNFSAATLTADLAWTSEEWTQIGASSRGSLAHDAVQPDPWRLVVGGTRYAPDGGRDDGLSLVSVLVEKPLCRWFSLSGRARSALSDGAGGYSEGLLGAALDWPLLAHQVIGIGAEVGAGGGGGLTTGSGGIASLTLRYRWQWTSAWGLHIAAGRLEAINDAFTTDLIEAGLVWSFARGLTR